MLLECPTCWGKHVLTECSVYPNEGPSNTAVGSFSTSRRNWSNLAKAMTPFESDIWEKISDRQEKCNSTLVSLKHNTNHVN